MKVAFRVDSSGRMGMGHLVRCLTLAEALRQRGADIRFICRAHAGHMIDLLSRHVMPVTILPAPMKAAGKAEDYAAWLGVPQETDAAETIEALDGYKPDWLIVDHYGLDSRWEQTLRPYTGNLLVIDDLANRHHDCDVLLDQNCLTDSGTRYRNLVPANCQHLLGPRYALLRPEYATCRKIMSPRDGNVRRLLLFFGGADPFNVTRLALEALSAYELRNLQVDVVMGVNNPYRQAIEEMVSQRPRTTLHGLRPQLTDLMANADLSLGAGGVTMWERLCLGLPSLVVSTGKNQTSTCESLAKIGMINYLGPVSTIRSEQISLGLTAMISNTEALKDISVQGKLLVDGLGVWRVAECIDPTPTDELMLRPAQQGDEGLGFDWSNRKKIPMSLLKEHSTDRLSLFQTHSTSPSNRLLMLEAGTLPVGQLQLDLAGDEARIDYVLDPLVLGRDWEGKLVSMACHMVQDSLPVALRADHKTDGNASRAFFMRFACEEKLHLTEKARFRIAVLSDRNSWLNEFLPGLILDWLKAGHSTLWTHEVRDLHAGEFCFYLSCGQIVPPAVLCQFRHNLVVHESSLPQGKGWSPLTWQILEGNDRIPVTLLEAAEKVDSGQIYAQEWIEFKGHELIDELRIAQAKATLALCRQFVSDYPDLVNRARVQEGPESFYPRRKPSDSRIHPERSLAEQFNLLRVVDNRRYPAFFDLGGYRFIVSISRSSETGFSAN